jgi:hypothetical protein
MEKNMKIISEFENETRSAIVIFKDETVFTVEMYEGDKLVGSREIVDHTLQYAEDCAENWVEGIIK